MQNKLHDVWNIVDGDDWRISLLAGYAGTDFLENLYRLRFAQFFKVS
ncbi:MAG: hypothetical protein G01um10147_382 [Microgenomates group bacterium Gr01-1014_7]|nr:MAG: hypothetical protein G01um10147_382 [Microgenomates group bacterium Gr01-1014_7]